MRNRYYTATAKAIAIERRRPDGNAHRSLLLKLALLLAGILVFTLAGTYTAGAEQVFPKNLALPNGIQPEGIATGRGTDFFVGSLADGRIYKGDLRTGEVLATESEMNPQIIYGEDLMSRISYVLMNDDGAEKMHDAIIKALNKLAAQAAHTAGLKLRDIHEMVVAGNTTMIHILLGINPQELGGAPFALATRDAVDVKARELGLRFHPGAAVHVLPAEAGHVGADNVGVLIAEEPHRQDELTLLVDVGTNAEIVLGSKARLLACSSPTGPAFEGAQISSGQRAAPGAIERIRIDAQTLEPRYKVIGVDQWSDEPGFEEAIAQTGVTGICGSGIIEAIAEMYLSGIINQDGLVDGSMAERSPRIEAYKRTFNYVIRAPRSEGHEPLIRITQNDVRAIQLGKAAPYAGVRLLMDKLGIEKVGKIRLAGAFGSHIDVKYAMILGLVPDCNLAKVQSAGNAAGTGARIALLNSRARDEIESVVRRIEKIDLWEISVVTFPMLPEARIANVKRRPFAGNIPTERDLERWLTRDAGLTRSEARAVLRDGLKGLKALRDAGWGFDDNAVLAARLRAAARLMKDATHARP